MPRLSTSPKVKNRIRTLLKKLLHYASPISVEPEYSPEIFDYRWKDEMTARPQLVVKTRLTVLAELIASDLLQPVSKPQVREVLLVLQQELKILVDHRIKTRGSDKWEFTLTLWDTNPEKNLREFDRLWQRYKEAQPGQSSAKASAIPNTQLLLAQQRRQARPLHNLRLRSYGSFIDSRTQLNQLLTLLDPKNPSAIMTVVGPGGIGKTTLALEAAYRCLAATQDPESFPETPTFDVIAFVSAQTRAFIGPHLSQRIQAERNLKDILREIARTVDRIEGMPTQLPEQIEYIQQVLKASQTLLILDNLETLETLDSLFTFLPMLPPTVKVILTSRIRLGIGTTIELDYLPTQPGYAFIEHQSRDKLVKCDINQLQTIYRLSGGLPLAMTYIVGHLSVYRQLPELERSRTTQTPHELTQYCTEASLKKLQDESTYHLLLAATLFTDKIPLKAAIYIAGLSSQFTEARQKFDTLYRLSLINKLDTDAYSMHSLTQDYVSTKLDADLDFKQQARERWAGWYIKLLSTFAEDWLDWQDYSAIQQDWPNIRAVVESCIAEGHYQKVWQAWRGLRSYTLYCGYWDERVEWMGWLMQEAQQLGDRAALAEALYYQGQTLAHMDEADTSGEALYLFEKAWLFREAVSIEFQFELVSYFIALSLRQNRLTDAQTWLAQGQTLLDSAAGEQKLHLRQQCQLRYYRAEQYLRQNQYEAARQEYSNALELAEATRWNRLIAYTKGWIARLLLTQKEYDQATRLLTESLDAAQKHRDKRSSALCYYTFAQIAKEGKDNQKLKDWVALAHREFQRLGMTKEATAAKALLKS